MQKFFSNPLVKHVRPTLLIIAAAFVLAVLFHGAASGDRTGYGYGVMGITMLGAPIMAGAGALAFVFRRTVIADWLGGACLFLATFVGLLVAMN